MGKAAVQLDVEMIKVISETAIEHYKKEVEGQKKQAHDRRLHNVKLLLRNYRTFAKHVGDVEQHIRKIDEQSMLDAIDLGELIVPTIKKSKERTLATVSFIDRMLNVYKVMCETTGNPEDARRYETIYHMYIAEDKKIIAEIADEQFLTDSMVYKNAKRAYEELTVLFFGVDSIQFQ